MKQIQSIPSSQKKLNLHSITKGMTISFYDHLCESLIKDRITWDQVKRNVGFSINEMFASQLTYKDL